MIQLRTFFLSIFCCLLAMNSYSQQTKANVSGTIVDETNQPVLNAIVIHMETQTNKIISSRLVDKAGAFKVDNVRPDREKVKITAMGYQDTDLVADSLKENIQLILRPLSVDLNEVVVLGKSSVVQKNDRLVFAISNSNITQGSNTYELLRFTPLVRVEDDKISLIGKSSVLLYINGRDSRLSGNAALEYLRSLPAEKIASVEVISNPMSTFKTSGNEGVINLILKKNEGDGLKGSITLDESYQHTNSLNGSTYLFYQKNKLNLTANIYGGNRRVYTKEKTEYTYLDANEYNVVESENDPNNKHIGGNITADYNFSEKQTLGIMINGGYQKKENDGIARTSYQKPASSTIDSVIYSSNLLRTPSYVFSGNLNYRIKTDDKGSELALDVDYLHNYKDAKSYADFSYIANESKQPPHDSFTQQSEDRLNNYSARAEYKHVFDDKNDLTTGLEWYTWNSGMTYFHGYSENGTYVSDPQKSNIFNYKETYGASFVSYNRIWSDKINSTIGARLEYNHVRGEQEVGNYNTVKQSNLNLSPSLAILYSINPDNRLSLNLSSFVARPSITHLNPFRFYTTPTTYIENDPNLRPSTFYMMGVNYTLRNCLKIE